MLRLFVEALALKPALSKKMEMEIVTKRGILPSKNILYISVHRYDYLSKQILETVNVNCQYVFAIVTVYIDTLLLHRPSPLIEANEVTQAFDLLFKLNKVHKLQHVGVSNFTPAQFDLLQSRLDAPLIVN